MFCRIYKQTYSVSLWLCEIINSKSNKQGWCRSLFFVIPTPIRRRLLPGSTFIYFLLSLMLFLLNISILWIFCWLILIYEVCSTLYESPNIMTYMFVADLERIIIIRKINGTVYLFRMLCLLQICSEEKY